MGAGYAGKIISVSAMSLEHADRKPDTGGASSSWAHWPNSGFGFSNLSWRWALFF